MNNKITVSIIIPVYNAVSYIHKCLSSLLNQSIKNYEIIGGIGVNLEEYSYKQPKIDKIHFGMVSRLLVEKGIREFVLAASQVKKNFLRSNLVLLAQLMIILVV